MGIEDLCTVPEQLLRCQLAIGGGSSVLIIDSTKQRDGGVPFATSFKAASLDIDMAERESGEEVPLHIWGAEAP